MADALQVALADLDSKERDEAVLELAALYAEAIDADASQLGSLGPKLLAVLDACLMTPAARAAVVPKGIGDAPATSSPVDELRDKRARRTSTVDTSPT